MRITIFISVLALSLFLGSCNVAFAQTSVKDLINSFEASPSANLGESLIYPASPLYFLKSLREKIEVFFDSNSDIRDMRQVEFMQRRLREVASLIKHGNQDLIPLTLEQYKLNLQNLDGVPHQSEEIQFKVGEAVSSHLDVLQHLYGSAGNPRAQQAIRAAIEKSEEFNSKLLQKLSLPAQQTLIGKIARNQALACKFLMRESSSSSLSDTERAFLAEKAVKCQEDIRLNLKDQLMEILKQKQIQATSSATGR